MSESVNIISMEFLATSCMPDSRGCRHHSSPFGYSGVVRAEEPGAGAAFLPAALLRPVKPSTHENRTGAARVPGSGIGIGIGMSATRDFQAPGEAAMIGTCSATRFPRCGRAKLWVPKGGQPGFPVSELNLDSTAKTFPLDRRSGTPCGHRISTVRLNLNPPYICAPFTHTLCLKMTAMRLGGGFCSGIILPPHIPAYTPGSRLDDVRCLRNGR
jgi:hypothetical protein